MSVQRVELKNPALAAFLAWLVPGLGHAYQGRWFKAVLYSACIWSTWGCGWVLGDGRVVYYNMDMKRGRWTAGFAAQAGVGGAALPAIMQSRRAGVPESRSDIKPLGPLKGTFDGTLSGVRFKDGRVAYFRLGGQLELQPLDDSSFRGMVKGTLTGTVRHGDESDAGVPDDSPVELTFSDLDSFEPEIFPSPHRAIKCRVSGTITGAKGGEFSADLRGKILNTRSLWNRYAAPLDADGLEAAHGELGKYWEIALAYTWIAGLLNLLAIWDAFEGPAYGYGNAEPTVEQAPAGTPPPEAAPVVASTLTVPSELPPGMATGTG